MQTIPFNEVKDTIIGQPGTDRRNAYEAQLAKETGPKMKPILFSTPMVQAILEDRKTQTRRIIKNELSLSMAEEGYFYNAVECANIKVGDILYVRETFGVLHYEGVDPKPAYFYKADGGDIIKIKGIWKPSIHMPKEAARIFLRITAVKAEKLNDITEADAIAEGCQSGGDWETAPTIAFASLWRSTYGPESWAKNPYVFAYTFERIEKPA